MRMLEFLERSAERIDQSFADRPRTAAWLHQVVGRSFKGLGSLEQAALHLETALAAFEDLPDTSPRELAEARGDLADLSIERGSHERASELLEAALAALGDAPEADEALELRLRARTPRVALARGTRSRRSRSCSTCSSGSARAVAGASPAEAAGEIARLLRALSAEFPELHGPELDSLLHDCDALSYAPAHASEPGGSAELASRALALVERAKEAP